MHPEKSVTLAKIKAMPDLPSPSGSARQIIRLTQADDVSLSQIELAIKVDPAFVARLIRVANSSRHIGGGRPVASIKDALMVLGLPAIRGLALGFSLFDGHREGRCAEFDYEAFWLRSLAMAQAFQHVAQQIKVAPADEAFSIGLLTNIGGLALATVFPEQYHRLLLDAKTDRSRSLEEREMAALGINHWELSAELLADWGFPPIYSRAVSLHKNSSADLPAVGSRAYSLTCALSLAADISDLMLCNELRTPEKVSELYRHGARVSLEAEQLVVFGKQIAVDWSSWVITLGLSRNHGMDFFWVEQATSDAHFLSQAVTGDRKSFSVLLVDDERSARMYLGRLLQDAGYIVMEADGGEQALAMARTNRPDLVLTDWVMPNMDGLQLIRALREESWGETLYILVITAKKEEENLVEAFDAGTNDFISKPIKPRVLLSRLKAGERMIRLQRETERQYQEMRDIASELSASNRRLQELSVTDVLTGCPNRRYALERIQQEWSGADRRDLPLSCLVVDVDWFKQINDLYGHDRGDEVLKIISAALRSGVRHEDVVCRVGGDEFWVICPGVDRSAAQVCGERLCKAVAALGIKAGHQLCTISVGVAERVAGMHGPQALIDHADKNLYEAKRAGRGRVG